MKGSIVQRSEGSWYVRFDAGRDANGRRIQKSVTVRGTKRQAERELTRMMHEFHTGQYVDPSRLTTGQYLRQWLTDYARANLAGKTCDRYEELIEKHLIPALGNVPLPKLQALHIQGYYAQALKSGRRDGKGGLSPQTVLNIHRLLRTALQRAIKWKLLARNPADDVDPPRPDEKEMQAIDEDVTAEFLVAARGTDLYLPILTAVVTGLRRGELLALRWQDLNLDSGTLDVKQALELTTAGIQFKQPKTARSRRTVTLPALVIEELRGHWTEQQKRRELLGKPWQNLDLIFCAGDGAPQNPRNFTKRFYDFVRARGLRTIRFHDLRHSHASQLLRQGVPLNVVSERLGHTLPSTTLNVYGHVLPGSQEGVARRVDEAMRAALEGRKGRAVEIAHPEGA